MSYLSNGVLHKYGGQPDEDLPKLVQFWENNTSINFIALDIYGDVWVTDVFRPARKIKKLSNITRIYYSEITCTVGLAIDNNNNLIDFTWRNSETIPGISKAGTSVMIDINGVAHDRLLKEQISDIPIVQDVTFFGDTDILLDIENDVWVKKYNGPVQKMDLPKIKFISVGAAYDFDDNIWAFQYRALNFSKICKLPDIVYIYRKMLKVFALDSAGRMFECGSDTAQLIQYDVDALSGQLLVKRARTKSARN